MIEIKLLFGGTAPTSRGEYNGGVLKDQRCGSRGGSAKLKKAMIGHSFPNQKCKTFLKERSEEKTEKELKITRVEGRRMVRKGFEPTGRNKEAFKEGTTARKEGRRTPREREKGETWVSCLT